MYSPGISSMLPLLYAAWADRVLTPSEINVLKQKAQRLPFLTIEDKEQLKRWSDPAHPPTRELWQLWQSQLRSGAEHLDAAGASLVDLGLQLAKLAANGSAAQWEQVNIRTALEEIEERLVAVDIRTYQSLFPSEATADNIEPLAGPDPVALSALLEGPYADIISRVKTLLSDPAFAVQPGWTKEAYRAKVLHWLQLLAQQGLGALSYPGEDGGRGDMGAYTAALEAIAYHDLSLAIKFGVQFGLFGGSILNLGTAYHHRKYLPQVGTLDLPGCFAMTETGHGSNVRGLETTATYDSQAQEFIIHTPHPSAGKEYIGNAIHGHMATVFTQLIVAGENYGVHAVLAPMRDKAGNLLPGVRVEDCGYKMGLNGIDNGRIWFDQVRVPRENLLNRFGDVSPEGTYSSPIEDPGRRFFTMLGTLVGGRVGVPRAGLSAAKTGLAIAVKYGLRRRQFGPSLTEPETLLLDYPSHQHRLMPLLAGAYAYHFALRYLTDRYLQATEADIQEVETLAAGLKSKATWFTTEALQECREACGGKGYLAENRFTELKADTDIFTTFEGDNTVLMQLVAKGLLSRFRKSLNEEGMWGVMRYLGDRVSTAVSERNPLVIRSTDREHLLDPEFHLNAFTYREKRLLYSVGQRLRAMIKDGQSSYDAFINCQTHLLSLADAYVDRVVLEQFQAQIERTESPELKSSLEQLCQLYALHTIEQNKGWYLEQEYMLSAKTKAIRYLVNDLCADVRKEALALVAAFDIPEALLRAPVAV